MAWEDDIEEARAFIQVELRSGERSARDIFSGARASGISRGALLRAQKQLGVFVYQQDKLLGGEWMWALPDQELNELFGQASGNDNDVPDHTAEPLRESVNFHGSGSEFERQVASLLKRMGFRVEVTGATNDGGIDIRAISDHPISGGIYLVQCKCFAPNHLVGSPTLRDLYGAVRANHRAVKGILVTTSGFTDEALRFAEDIPLTLIDGERLQILFQQYVDRADE